MRQGPYELQLVTTGGDNNSIECVLQERDIHGMRIVTAEPGQSYHVKINIYRDHKGRFPSKYLRFGLYVDGIDVQYWKRIDLSNEKLLPSDPMEPVVSRFLGFKKNTTEMLSFVFSMTDTTTQPTSHKASLDSLGTIKLEIFEAQVTVGVYENQSGYGEVPQQTSVGESAKFWQQASVTTTAGKSLSLAKEKFCPLPRWSNCSKQPLDTITLRYHTATMIQFLEEFQHKLSEKSSSSSSMYELVDLTGDESKPPSAVNPPTLVPSNSNCCSSNISENEASGDAKRQRISLEPKHSSAALLNSSENLDEQENEREEQIDEDVTLVVRKKIVPFLDLSDEATN